jgi:2-methylfumaryl-CoA hydratase
MVLEAAPFTPIAGETPIALDRVIRRDYGHFLEDFVPGRVFRHPRGVTLDAGFIADYTRTFMEANPSHLNASYALAAGYDGIPAPSHLVMNLALSLGVQTDSEKAIANLGYYDVRFLRPVYAGDTLTGLTRVVERRDRGGDKPGIATVETLAQNQDGKVVVQYRRKIMLPKRDAQPLADAVWDGPLVDFPWSDAPKLHIPLPRRNHASFELTTGDSLLGNFEAGQIWVHPNGRTVTDEHYPWTYKVMNTHPLHYDRLYSSGRSGPMSGEPIVYGGLVFAWLLGLASRDVAENAVWDLGYHFGFHTQPTVAGDTLYALSRVLSVSPFDAGPDGPEGLGVVRMQLIGLKNVRAEAALETHGADLFVAEDAKKDLGKSKIPEKVFEIERSLLIPTSRL